MRKILYILVILSGSTWGQQFSLEDCIQYGLTKNLQLKKIENEIARAKNNHQQAQLNFIPNLNGGASYGYNWGQSLDPFTNQFASTQVNNASIYLSSEWELFTGLRNFYGTKIGKNNVEYAQLFLNIEKKKLETEICKKYLNCLLSIQTVKLDHQYIAQLDSQIYFIQQKIETGHATETEIITVKSQKSLRINTLLQDSILLKNALLDLKFTMNYPLKDNIEIQEKLQNISAFEQNTEVENLDEVNIQLKKITLSELEVKRSKSGYIPSLSLFASIGTGYSGNYKQTNTTGETSTVPLGSQLRDNLYQNASISLRIPIFNRHVNKRQQKNLEIDLQNENIELDYAKQNLELRIQSVINELESLNEASKIIEEMITQAENNFEMNKIRYQHGKITRLELTESQMLLFQNKQELINLHYKIYFATKILEVTLRKD
ncbi:MAG: TolC family protein [Crocinitomicaceae bacterium]